MLGPVQEKWLFAGLGRSRARWNALAQQVIFSPFDQQPGEGEMYSMDKWDGYPAARGRVVEEFARLRERDPSFSAVVLSGDNHNHWMFDIERAGKPVASEFAGTSITSNGDGADTSEEYGAAVR
jgi:alkaline phosphatase D